jgi:hypothetical protein
MVYVTSSLVVSTSSIIPAFLWIFYLLNGIIRDDPIAEGIDRFDLNGVIAI